MRSGAGRARDNQAPLPDITLVPLEAGDREQFIADNQEAFLYGATQEFGLRDSHFEEDGQIISRRTIERAIDGEHAEAWRIVLEGRKVGGLVLSIDAHARRGELELLFVAPDAHSRGVGQAAWREVERTHPQVRTWGLMTPYFEKRNIHFYVNRLGFHIVEFFNPYHPEPQDPDDPDPEGSGPGGSGPGDSGPGADGGKDSAQDDDGMFRFEKVLP